MQTDPDSDAPRGTLLSRARAWAKRLKADIEALASAARDPRVTWVAKLVVLLVVAYALSPIDLIPDFIPVIGYLDDLLLLPLGIALAIRLIPDAVLAEHRARAISSIASQRKSRAGAAIVIAVWIVCAALVLWWLF